jgi:hypothetical protein
MLDIDQLVTPQSKTLNCVAWYEIGTDMQAHFHNVCRIPEDWHAPLSTSARGIAWPLRW